MRKLAEETWHTLCQNWKNVLLFELLYRGIMLPVYLQLTNRALQTALRAAGYSYLTADNIIEFLMRPGTVLIGVLFILVGILLIALETAGLITAFQGAAYSYKLSPLHILWGGIQKIDEEITKKNLLLICLILPEALLYSGIYGAVLLHAVNPMNQILEDVQQNPTAKMVLFILLAAAAVIAVMCMFLFHICMIEQKNWKEAVERNRELLYKHRGKAVCHLFLTQLAAGAGIFFLYRVSAWIFCLHQVRHADLTVVKASCYSGMQELKWFWLMIGGIVSVVVHHAALTAMFYEYAKRRYHVPDWKLVYPARRTAAWRHMAVLWCLIAAAAVFMFVDFERHGFAISKNLTDEIQITAHRGSTLHAPENTMAAVRQAIEEMADSVEIDVQMTKDGVVVLGNDASLKRVAGVNRAISNMTLEEVQKLDVGGFFSPEFSGEQIPTLADVLAVCRGNIHVNIEIKPARRNSTIAECVVELIREQEMERECTVMSASMIYLNRVKELEPKLRTGYIISAAYGDFEPGQQVDIVSIRYPFADEKLVAHIHSQGKRVYAWTVNIPAEVKRLKQAGVDGIITDRPVMVREMVYQNRKTEHLIKWMSQMFRQEN